MLVFICAGAGILGSVFARSLTGFAAASGVLALVIGFALRNIILDIFTGLAINFDRSYQIGDWVQVHHRSFADPVYGKVVEINWRTTRVELENKNIVVIPNNIMSMVITTNFSMPSDLSRVEIPITLDFSVPSERARRIILGGLTAAVGHKGIVGDPAPEVLVGKVTDHGIEYLARVWARVHEISPTVARNLATQKVLVHLARTDLRPAYPKEEAFFARLSEDRPVQGGQQARLALLSRIEIFKNCLEKAESAQLAERMTPRHFPTGQSLIRQGEDGQSMFVLAEGLVEVFVRSEDATAPTRVGQIEPGHFFGEMSLLTGDPRSATVTAATDVVAYEISKEQLAPLLAARPALAETISALVAARNLTTTEALAAATGQQHAAEQQRLAARILKRMQLFFGSSSTAARVASSP